MPPMPAGTGGHRGPTALDKFKMGAMMGTSVGLIFGFLYGVTTIVRHGPGPNGIPRTLGRFALSSGAMFGFFMSIGAVVRSEESTPSLHKAYARARYAPVVVLPGRHVAIPPGSTAGPTPTLR